jgi:hypothetical protein
MRYIHIANGVREVRELPTLADSDDLLPHLQGLVGGYLESFQYVGGERPGTKLCAMGNEDGRRLKLPPNVRMRPGSSASVILVGPVIVVGIDQQGDMRGLTDSEIERVAVFPSKRHGDTPELFIAPHAIRVAYR